MILRPIPEAFGPNEFYLLLSAASWVSYFIFHKYEPRSTVIRAFLLLFVPLGLSFLSCVAYDKPSVGLLGTFVTYWLLLLSFTVFYRLSPFHPLAKFPGPLAHKISKFRTAYACSEGHLHQYYQKLHQIYGDVVRVGPNELSYCNVDGVDPVLGSHGLPKGPYYDDRHPKRSTLVSTRDNAEHAQRRRPWTRAFNTTSLKEYELIVIRRSRELIDALAMRTSETVDMSKWMEYFSFDFMGDMVFTFSFDMMKGGGDTHGYWDIMNGFIKFTAIISHIPWATKTVRAILSPGEEGSRMHQISGKMIGQRVKAGSVARDLYYHISNEDIKGSGALDPGQMISDGVTAIIAGSDTTSTVLANLWHHLTKNPSFYMRLREEVDATFPSGEEPINQQKLVTMPYLHACINESMRLQPPVPSGTQRAVLRGSGGKTVGRHFIPEGTNIIVHPYSLHRDPRYFSPYPEEFWPDRWLVPEHRRSLHDVTKPLDPTTKVVLDTRAFIPFSYGPRVCVGKNLAFNEMRVIASYIVQRFDMRFVEGFDPEEWERGLEDYFMLKKSPLRVVLSERA